MVARILKAKLVTVYRSEKSSLNYPSPSTMQFKDSLITLESNISNQKVVEV